MDSRIHRGLRQCRRRWTTTSMIAAMCSLATPNAEAWLDSIHYSELLDKLGYGPEVRRYIDPYIAVANFGVCGNAISAYAAMRLGSARYPNSPAREAVKGAEARDLVRRRVLSGRQRHDPENDAGTYASRRHLLVMAASQQPLPRPSISPMLDRAGAPVTHPPQLDGHQCAVTKATRPAAGSRHRDLCSRRHPFARFAPGPWSWHAGGWVNRNIVTDLPEAHAAAYQASFTTVPF